MSTSNPIQEQNEIMDQSQISVVPSTPLSIKDKTERFHVSADPSHQFDINHSKMAITVLKPVDSKSYPGDGSCQKEMPREDFA